MLWWKFRDDEVRSGRCGGLRTSSGSAPEPELTFRLIKKNSIIRKSCGRFTKSLGGSSISSGNIAPMVTHERASVPRDATSADAPAVVKNCRRDQMEDFS